MRGKNFNSIFIVICSLLLFSTYSCDKKEDPSEIRLVTWNVHNIGSFEKAEKREKNLLEFASEIHPSIILLQEISSLEVLDRIKEAMKLEEYYMACSQFSPPGSADKNKYEVGIISEFELNSIIEFDPKPDSNMNSLLLEYPIIPLVEYGIKEVETSRGFLEVRIDKIDMFIYIIHLKSSQGAFGFQDLLNAQKREMIISGVADRINQMRKLYPNYTFVVGGDFNIGHGDDMKNGSILEEDCYTKCMPGDDLYDDTHSILSKGIIGGLCMRNLTKKIKETTFPSFPGTPIDNIYVYGQEKDEFEDAVKSSSTYGSDHCPVITRYYE